MRRFFHDGAVEKTLVLLNPRGPNAITSHRHLFPHLHTGSGFGDASRGATCLSDSRHCARWSPDRSHAPCSHGQPVHPHHALLPVTGAARGSCHHGEPRPHTGTPPGLRDRIPAVLQDPPSSAASECLSALEERGPQLKTPAYVGISRLLHAGNSL
jgi:hypothetical protein